MNQPIDLEGLRARADAAASGEWYSAKDGETVWCRVPNFGDLRVAEGMDREEADFIAHARQDIPALLDEVERLRAENDRLQGLLDMAMVDMEIACQSGDYCLVCGHNDHLDGCTASGAKHGIYRNCKEDQAWQWRGFGESEGGE
ncbi:hypothetical protein LJC49_09665 [Ruminococcaceae bacterium OttesenSCG-928-I18]|nr:hypothetical protein [Ruminococcaceae bacterium OttesenSCG-928-I18]